MIQCQSTLEHDAECSMCKNRKRTRPDLIFWRIRSTDPDRRHEIVFCDECMGTLTNEGDQT